ncbi:hypothetical protein LJC61_02820 [Ruminococcaceae bacterium OttesenSCG-928-A16]|nr:hypothetical protein [Ruminococcaceae bacterium OttesenSCG-928-A16]
MEIVTSLLILVVFAIIVEFTVNVLKGLIPSKAQQYITPLIQAAAVGILLALAFSLDMFAMLGFADSTIPLVGNVITGLVISAGSVPVHELIAKLRASRDDL